MSNERCSVCGESPDARTRHRPYELTVSVTGDTWEDVAERVRELTEHLTEHGAECGLIVGGPGASGWVKVRKFDVGDTK